jgi:hypothetical protein
VWGKTAATVSGIKGASDVEAGLVEDVGVDLGGGDILVTEQFLDGPDVVMVFQEVGGEAVPEGMAGGGFGDLSRLDGGLDGALDHVFTLVVPADGPGPGVGGETVGGEDPEPRPLFAGVGVFAFKGTGEVNAGQGLGAILVEELASAGELVAERVDGVSPRGFTWLEFIGGAFFLGNRISASSRLYIDRFLSARPAESGPMENSHRLEKLSHPLEKDSHRLEKDSHRLEKDSHRLEKDSHRLEKDSHRLEKDSHRLEKDSHRLEKDSHRLEKDSHRLEKDSHRLEKDSHRLEKDSHRLEKDSHRLEKDSHRLEKDSHRLEKDSHRLEKLSHR